MFSVFVLAPASGACESSAHEAAQPPDSTDIMARLVSASCLTFCILRFELRCRPWLPLRNARYYPQTHGTHSSEAESCLATNAKCKMQNAKRTGRMHLTRRAAMPIESGGCAALC